MPRNDHRSRKQDSHRAVSSADSASEPSKGGPPGSARSGAGVRATEESSPVERLNAYLTQVFFGGDVGSISESEFEGEYRQLARLANVFVRVVRRAMVRARAAESAVRERERRLQLVAQCSSDAIVAFDASGKLLFANPAWLQRTGIDASAFPPFAGMPAALPLAEERRSFQVRLEGALRGEAFRLEYRVHAADGGERWIDGQWSPLWDGSGRAIGVVGVERDETERRQSEERLRIAKRLESLGRLAAGVAHDFNNLLTVFSVQLDAMEDYLREQPRAREMLVPMRAAAARATDLVRQLLLFGRKDPKLRAHFDLRDPVNEVVSLLRRTLGSDHRLHCEIDEAPIPVEGERSQITQVVMNLCLNARDAMPHGGPIRLRLAQDRSGDAGPRAVLEIADRGNGIAPADRERIFEPFFSTKEEGRGAGLGLALVHEIVHRHGGTIDVTTAVGSGSRFRVVLPVSRAMEPAPPAAAKPGSAPNGVAKGARILVVEPDAELRGVLQTALERAGHRVFIARDALEAASLASGPARGIDVLITCPRSGGVSGAEIARAVEERTGPVSVIYATGRASETEGAERSDAESALDRVPRGARILAKPFSVANLQEALVASIRDVEARRRSAAKERT